MDQWLPQSLGLKNKQRNKNDNNNNEERDKNKGGGADATNYVGVNMKTNVQSEK